MINPESAQRFIMRSKIIHWLRNWLHSKAFLEVETPILTPRKSGGALATHFAVGDAGFLRIAPELALKRCIIGGLERVFEIGKQFRDEGQDRTHHPEFTTIEAYQAFANVELLFGEVEEMLSGLCKMLFEGSLEANGISFQPPYPRINVSQRLEHLFGGTPVASITLQDCLKILGPQSECTTLTAALGKVIERFLEAESVTVNSPIFLCGHPAVLSPLAKYSSGGVAERFELFVRGVELVNAYSEQNDPALQKGTLVDEAEFCEALHYGMPETAGWGMGIDRLVMLFSGAEHIRDVILFP